ncbi:hypothetical protein AGMMS49959_13800 [Planctomycetales bacterium]|nr:hypothetical protein AGMMS49959_13800 [Planctomycetales bacterium]
MAIKKGRHYRVQTKDLPEPHTHNANKQRPGGHGCEYGKGINWKVFGLSHLVTPLINRINAVFV